MHSLRNLVSQLGPEIEDPEEETFLLYSQHFASQNLGFIDPKAKTLDITIHQRDYTIHQSPGILSSSRAGGTTGAVLWKVSPLFAAWLSSPSNPILSSQALSRSSSVIELGCGISPLNALALRPFIARYLLTDQPYVLKLLQQNIDANPPPRSLTSTVIGIPTTRKHRHRPARSSPHTSSASSSPSRTPTPTSSRTAKRDHTSAAPAAPAAEIRCATLDWETDQVTPALIPGPTPPDAIISCDCVFNYALIPPLVQTCADICRLKSLHNADTDTDMDPEPDLNDPSDPDPDANANTNANADPIAGLALSDAPHPQATTTKDQKDKTTGRAPASPCLVIIAQQLRNDDVFTSWLTQFRRHFRVWRVPEEILPEGLRPAAGFVIHVGILRAHAQGIK